MKELIYKFAVAYSRRDFAFAEKLIASGRINPMPMFEGTVSMADFPAQFEALRTNKLACKIMLQP
jgi:threonine dehydrogenase-like Zn-dependent dehydrogenase